MSNILFSKINSLPFYTQNVLLTFKIVRTSIKVTIYFP